MVDDWSEEPEGGYVMSDQVSPDDFAHAFVRRPGMFIGSPVTFDRATAFILGLETVLLMRPGSADDAQQQPTRRFNHLMRRDPGKDEQAAIASLEPVLAAVLIAVQESQDKCLR